MCTPNDFFEVRSFQEMFAHRCMLSFLLIQLCKKQTQGAMQNLKPLNEVIKKPIVWNAWNNLEHRFGMFGNKDRDGPF